MTTYYNTTDLKGKVLAAVTDKAKSQDTIILRLFVLYKELSPAQAYHYMLDYSNAPITSVRRSITNLTRDGLLIKTNQKTTGMYGRPEYVWKIAGVQLKLF